MEQKRVATRVHTRRLDRATARANMKKAGISQVAKHDLRQSYTLNGKRGEIIRTDSYFAKNWRDFV